MSKKRVAKVIAFLVVFVLLFLMCSMIFITNSNNTRNIRGIYAENEDSVDVLLVGASSVKTNFAPALAYQNYGFTSFALSFDGTAFEMLETLTKESLQYQSPEVVLVDLKPVTAAVTNQKARAVIDNIRWSDNKREAIEKYASEDSKISFYLTLDKYHSRWKDISSVLGYYYLTVEEAMKYDFLSQYSLKEIFVDKKHPLKGFYTSSVIQSVDMYKAYEEVTEKEKISESSETALYEIMDYFKENNVNAVFYISPMCYYEGLLTEHKYPQKLNYAKEIVESNGFECLDFRTAEHVEKMNLDYSTDFGDYLHMNVNGALKFTEYLSSYLKERYDLPDHRGESAYEEEWQRSVECMANVIEYCKNNVSYK